jgi:uncharacterized protein
MKSLKNIIQNLQLMPHPEGGYYRETYRSPAEIGPDSLEACYHGARNYSTCIYFLLTSRAFSAFHRIRQDEIWHFYDGSPICLHIISPGGVYSQVTVGRDFTAGQVPQFVIRGGSWFAAQVINSNDYSLVGCTVSPGFDFADFELGNRIELMKKFPAHQAVIVQLTRR